VKKALYIAASGLLLMFLLLNIASSQSISPLYFDLVKKDTDSTVAFLQHIKQLPDFKSYKDLFNLDIQKQFAAEETDQIAEIRRFEGLLEKNPFARDVLSTLSFLHNQAGNKNKAQEYLKKAQKIDPNVK